MLLHEKLAFRYFKSLYESKQVEADEYHILNEKEIKTIQNIRLKALVFAASFGTMGVLLLYAPVWYCGYEFFWIVDYELPYLGLTSIPVGFTLYGIILAIIEIAALMLLNLHTVNQISEVCGYPNIADKQYEQEILQLFEVSMEKHNVQMLAYKINPLEGLSKFQIFAITAFNMLKATLSNMVIKMLLGRILGGFILRFVFLKYLIDLISIPIFAFWDAYTTNRVIHQAKVRIMAGPLIYQLVDKLYLEFKDNEDIREILSDVLKLIAVAKRTFHHNHFLLVAYIFQKFDLKVKESSALQENILIQNIKKMDKTTQVGLGKLLIFGILIDGKLSIRERKSLRRLNQEMQTNVSYKQLKVWERSFIRGRGLESLFQAKLL